MTKRLLALALWTLSLACHAAGERFTVFTVDPAEQDLQLFLRDEQGRPFHHFSRLSAWLQGRGKRLAFAVNAGMYHHDFSPVGLLVQDGKEVAPLNLASGVGNFFLKPNGVFLLSDAGPKVVESGQYGAHRKGVRLATQSGPLLLRDGVMHPAFQAASTSRHIRNGVGIANGKVVFVISNEPVTFYALAAFFRDQLHCRDALYLDGAISGMHALPLRRSDPTPALGPILGVVQ